MIKEAIITRGLLMLFKIGLKNDLPEKAAQKIEDELDKLLGEGRSEKTQARFETFLDTFVARVKAQFRKDRKN